MSDLAVLYELTGATALLTINRPKTLNALDLPTLGTNLMRQKLWKMLKW